jgi:hypothetical protein
MKANIIEPIRATNGKWNWPELELKQSNQPNAGKGVFARVNIPVGTMVPLLGKVISSAEHDKLMTSLQATHTFSFYRTNIIINGNPRINNHGLNIAMMTNEPCKKRPNCIFKLGFLVVAKHIKVGEELTVYYGNTYRAIRDKLGYSLVGNTHLHSKYLQDNKYLDLYRIETWPCKERRYRIINKWLDVIDKTRTKTKTKTKTKNKYQNRYQVCTQIESKELDDDETLAYLKSNTFNPNAPDGKGCSPLIFAVDRNKQKCVQYLLDMGADLNYVQPNRDNALSTAIYHSNFLLANILIEKGLNINDIRHLDPNKIKLFEKWIAHNPNGKLYGHKRGT